MSDLRLTYRDAGVDIDAANEAVHRMREHVRSTFTPQVLTDIGSFGGMFALSGIEGYSEPVLVSSIDGVGTKVKIAAQLGSHSSIGQDLVNHCVNDILVQGARPLFFLDYFGTGRLVPVVAEEIIRGLSEACKAVGCALIGGETAEMPGLYPEGEYDLVGCIVGIVDRHRIIDGTKVAPGDTVIGLASNGLHTNGFSLARKALLEGPEPFSLYQHIPCLGRTLGEELLAIHRCYAPAILPLLTSFDIHAMAHITGGGFYENIPRVVPPHCSITIDRRSWKVPPIFTLIQEKGGVPEPEMYRTFNMGIGMVLIVPPDQAPLIVNYLNEAGEVASIIGDIRQGVHEVIII
ncbi:MAG TPA: phosphoribosylformylglycinamidine cyclo-ligase [Chthonomonas sp.]|uniref:phosphoribosylformylglycinamidine cyclo-ligase n=1 Tax=Chthonomonas sp. TaxID=2282153 RepID=UPI002B4B69FB|nr:phosphoribosylformylglycinamidine cyclo-ligase [Chthonomonas sp.]HLH79818.1 phosphoribosylformylglycinamidine cyclo-ligase [Chthonomonas sp.]